MLLVPQIAASTWRVVCALVCLLFSPVFCLFLVFLCLQAVMFFFFFLLQLLIFKCLPHPLRGGHDSLFLLLFLFNSFFRFVFVVFFSSVFALFSFVSLFDRLCVFVSCLWYHSTWPCIAHCLCLLHTRYVAT